MSKRESNKAVNRANLVKSAAQAFAVHGLKGSNINTISLDAGLGKGTVYNYFPSKDELYLAVLNWLGEELTAGLKDIESPASNSVRERLVPVVEAVFRFYAKNPALTKLLIRAIAGDRVDHQRQAMAACQAALDAMQAPLADGKAKGLRTDLDPFISAVTLWGMINHQAAFHWLVSTRELEPASLTDLVLTYFLQGLAER